MSMRLQMNVIKLEKRVKALEAEVKRLSELSASLETPPKRGPGRPRKDDQISASTPAA